MTGTPDETKFEKDIVQYLTTRPLLRLDGTDTGKKEYLSGEDLKFDKDLCLIKREVLAFLKETQPESYRQLEEKRGSSQNVQYSIFGALRKLLDEGGALAVLNREDIAIEGINFKMIFFKPANNKAPENEQCYLGNRLVIKEQLHYSKKEKSDGKDASRNAIDMAIFVNGIPVFTFELKNELRGQTYEDAMEQYRNDRNTDGERLLEFKRCLAHFAVSTEQVFMTTKLENDKTQFLPFNKTYNNEGVQSDDYRTSYLWEDVLRRDSVFDLIENFVRVFHKKEKYYDPVTGKVETQDIEKLIFPRWHQRRAVHRLIDDVRKVGCGHNYLIEHSAGSGKSYTITWLAYAFSGLYRNPTDESPLFDSIIIVNDRRVLDRQTQHNFHEFERMKAEVAYVDNKKTAQDLKKYIEDRMSIIVTTLQKFSVICDAIKHFPDRRFAVIIDEAHSSQTGDSARDMRQSLSLEEAELFDEQLNKKDEIDKINEIAQREATANGVHRNVSFFAFTATPKPETITVFAERHDGKKKAFDTYTMEQAINEGFIRDVLENYMSFKRYFQLMKRVNTTDKEYDKKKAVRLLSRWVDLQPAAIMKKSRIMLEQFASQTVDEIEGRARAMLVTRSRLHAVRYKLAFEEIMRDMQLPYGCLVAFSGSVYDRETDESYTESSMNHLPRNASIPDAFMMPQYRILIVANKYQTGFDEPLLHTMFVDKPLEKVNAVQTLSRLNRTMPGKDSTLVIDFVNKPETIQKAFQDYYGENYILQDDDTDPEDLEKALNTIKAYGIIQQSDIDLFAKYTLDSDEDNKYAVGVLDKVVDRVRLQLKGERLEKFRMDCGKFVRLYKMFRMVMSFGDKDAEYQKAFLLLIELVKKLIPKGKKLPYEVLDKTQLISYKAQFQYKKRLALESKDNSMKGIDIDRVSEPQGEDNELLSTIIDKLNKKYALNLSDDDRVEMERMNEELQRDGKLMGYFISTNTRDNVKSEFDKVVDTYILDLIIKRNRINLYRTLSEERINKELKQQWFNDLYDKYVRNVRL